MNNSESDEQSGKKSGGRGRARGRGRPPGRPPGRASKRGKKKTVVGRAIKQENDVDIDHENDFVNHISPKLAELNECTDADITSHAISFVSPASKALNWKYKVNLIGEKVVNPRIHCCEKCKLPILVYGRMIPCKHIFCLSCAKQNELLCPRCNDKVLRVEKSGLGTVFMCQTEPCKRTYLSQRDLQAHIQHRHVRRLGPTTALPPNGSNNVSVTTNASSNSLQSQSHGSTQSSNARNMSYNSNTYQSPIPVVSSRSNLITVPIQDEVNVLSQMSSPVNSQSPMIVSNQQQIPNYVSTQQYQHHNQHNQHNQHMQWQPMTNANAFSYRPPTHWPPINHPYNPYNRRYFQ